MGTLCDSFYNIKIRWRNNVFITRVYLLISLSYFFVMRFLMDVLGFLDSYFLVTAIAVFFCDIPGSFIFNLTYDALTVHESHDVIFGIFYRTNSNSWKNICIEIIVLFGNNLKLIMCIIRSMDISRHMFNSFHIGISSQVNIFMNRLLTIFRYYYWNFVICYFKNCWSC